MENNILLPHKELNEENFLALNGFEWDVTEEGALPGQDKCCHICLIALEEDNLIQPCWHREDNRFFHGNGKKYKHHVFYPVTCMTPHTTDPYSYAYCCCMFAEESGNIMASKEAFDNMDALGIEGWAGAGVKDEAGVDEMIAKAKENASTFKGLNAVANFGFKCFHIFLLSDSTRGSIICNRP